MMTVSKARPPRPCDQGGTIQTSMTPISPAQFDRARQLALRLAGIELYDRHREILIRRSQRLGIEDAVAFDALLDRADIGDERAGQRLVGLVTTNFTCFFRNPQHFEAAAAHAFRAVRDRGRARIWSAAASTGEEPYSTAIAILDAFGTADPPVTILATDIDDDALDIARRGEYAETSISTLDQRIRSAYVRPVDASARWGVTEPIRRLVVFRRENLIDPEWADDGCFDVILCRNVLMYLEAGRREGVARRMWSMLAPDGILILDPAEHLGRAASAYSHRGGGIFVRRQTVQTPLGAVQTR